MARSGVTPGDVTTDFVTRSVERVSAMLECALAPRGYKAWGLLAYLLRADRPPSRDELVSLLFGEADDPFAALRWNLSALRRLLGDTGLEGDPVRLSLPPGAFVDVETLIAGSWTDALRLPGIERELLEGMSFSSSPTFDIWLSTERRHLGATAEAVFREAALARLGAVELLLRDAAETGDVRDDVAPRELASYCLHALSAAGGGHGHDRRAEAAGLSGRHDEITWAESGSR